MPQGLLSQDVMVLAKLVAYRSRHATPCGMGACVSGTSRRRRSARSFGACFVADPNRALFESVVRLLAPVLDDLVFVGGRTGLQQPPKLAGARSRLAEVPFGERETAFACALVRCGGRLRGRAASASLAEAHAKRERRLAGTQGFEPR